MNSKYLPYIISEIFTLLGIKILFTEIETTLNQFVERNCLK